MADEDGAAVFVAVWYIGDRLKHLGTLPLSPAPVNGWGLMRSRCKGSVLSLVSLKLESIGHPIGLLIVA